MGKLVLYTKTLELLKESHSIPYSMCHCLKQAAYELGYVNNPCDFEPLEELSEFKESYYFSKALRGIDWFWYEWEDKQSRIEHLERIIEEHKWA